MATYLLTWNPDIAGFPDMETNWSTGNRKNVEPNSHFFFLQQGGEGRGIIGRGNIASHVVQAPHWDEERAANGETANYVDLVFTELIDPVQNPELRLDVSILQDAGLERGVWQPQASGSKLSDEVANKIEELWERVGSKGVHPPLKVSVHGADDPVWTRDETILALNLYFRANRKELIASDERVIELSKLINSLPLYPQSLQRETRRSLNDLSLKLGNFHNLDSLYAGRPLHEAAELELEIWNEFVRDRKRLQQIAEAIRKSATSVPPPATEEEGVAEDEEFVEGRILTRLHKLRERDPRAVLLKKADAMQRHGILSCEACDFDFARAYGKDGVGFAECHHRRPLCELGGIAITKLSDLAIVCANCHRMLHVSKPAKTVEELRLIVESRREVVQESKIQKD
jgi:5-methylcytosine-specific restriction protein A